MSTSDPNAAVVSTVIAASAETIYDAWVDPEAMTDWIVPTAGTRRPDRAGAARRRTPLARHR